jgi:hypothetical protein
VRCAPRRSLSCARTTFTRRAASGVVVVTKEEDARARVSARPVAVLVNARIVRAGARDRDIII